MTRSQLVEVVPNVSEGRTASNVAAMGAALGGGAGSWVLDTHSDPSHHRSVFTAVLDAGDAVDACARLAHRAIELIDLREHRGVHPRIGALDVLPFVPLGELTTARAIELARRIGAELAERFCMPVFLYGAATARASGLELKELRRGGVDGLAERMATGVLSPDFGPTRPHLSAGAVAVGVRGVLIAYNVALRTEELDIAKAVARRIRGSSGGLRGVQALGLRLGHRELTQVSMNLTDHRSVSLEETFRAVREEAGALGVAIDHSEIVGLIPKDAAFEGMAEKLVLERDPGILEDRMSAVGLAPTDHPPSPAG